MGDMKVNPSRHDRIIQKYQEQQARNLKEVLESKGAKSQEELLEIEKKAIVEQQARRSKSGEVVELKDRSVKIRAKSQEINEIEDRLRKEINVALEAIPHISSEDRASAASLKDRVQPGTPKLSKET